MNRPLIAGNWKMNGLAVSLAELRALKERLGQSPVPEVDVSGHSHVRHEFGERIEKYVESRRGRSLEEVLDELEERLAGLGWQAEVRTTGREFFFGVASTA